MPPYAIGPHAPNLIGKPARNGRDVRFVVDAQPSLATEVGWNAVTEDELRQRFDLTLQATGTWSADTADFIRAAAEAEAGVRDEEAIEAAQRTLTAIKEEQRALEEACRSSSYKSDDLEHGLATAMTELYHLDREITDALTRMRGNEDS